MKIAPARVARIVVLFSTVCTLPIACIMGTGLWADTVDDSDAVSVVDVTDAFEDTVDVELVNVEIRVEDRKGRPVRGLKADDFKVFEDRRAVELLHFSEFSDAPTSGESAGKDQETRDVSTPPQATEDHNPAPVLVLYFDNSHLRTAGRKRLVRDLRRLIESDGLPVDRLMMVAQDTSLQPLAAIGSDKKTLAAALDSLQTSPAQGHEVDRNRALLMERFAEIVELAGPLSGNPCTLLRDDGMRDARNYGYQVAGRVSLTLGHLGKLAASLAGIPGPKSVLYFGGGLELLPLGDIVHYLSEICPQMVSEFQRDARALDMTSRFERLTRDANANRVTFYPMDTRGSSAGSSAGVEHSSFKWKPSPVNDQVRLANLENSLSFMAADTGGKASFRLNSVADDVLAAADDAASYYSVAYRPLHGGDGKVHMIDVEVRRPKKARVRHRLSYRDKAADERVADRLQAALNMGLQDNPLGVTLSRGPSEKAKDEGLFEVPMRVSVPLSSLVFVAEGDVHVGRLRLQVGARDIEGRVSAFHQKQFEVKLDPSLKGQARGNHVFIVDLTLRPGAHVVAAALEDGLGGTTSFLASKITVEVP